MPSQRRLKVVGLLVVIGFIIILYTNNAGKQTRSSDFYTKTQEALQAREYEAAAKQRDADDVGSRLKAAEDAAKKSADDRNQKYMDSVGGGTANEKSVAGRVKLTQQGGDEKKMQGVAAVGGRPRDKEGKEAETLEEHEIEVELNAILKKSPLIIFSKSYCPFSKKAKRILLEKYKIDPAPFVVELDEHPLGEKLQATLGQSTGRKTVPNILMMGKSIGGGDEIEELDLTGKLENTIKSMGGSRIVDVARRVSSPPEMRA